MVLIEQDIPHYTEQPDDGPQSELGRDTSKQTTCYVPPENLLVLPSLSRGSHASYTPRPSATLGKAAVLPPSRFQSKRKLHDDEPKNLAQEAKRPSYAASIGSVVENLMRMCPAEHQQELGLFILECAHKKYAVLKNTSCPQSKTRESITVRVDDVKSNPEL